MAVIKVENLSKQYRLGSVGLGSLGADVNRWWHTRIRGKEDPYLKIGEENDREVRGGSEYVWALRDINFDVRQGEVLGIIGRNGAGKSTLLKILSRTTGPTTGSIKIKGRVASLLEVGTGFHPELTGRENIFLNGAILGMTRQEIRSKFDEIVAFAGVERYVDTPVKRYSSGMYVRLAFAVAAHLEPEILIVDEVLAVGDAEFQKKAIGKMKEVSEGQGRTVLFVSHNMGSIRKLCNRVLLLKNGYVDDIGETDIMIDEYENEISNEQVGDLTTYKRENGLGEEIFFTDVRILNEDDVEVSSLYFGENFHIDLTFASNNKVEDRLNIGVRFETINDIYITSCLSSDNNQLYSIENADSAKTVRASFENFRLAPGCVYITISIRRGKVFYDQVVRIKRVEILKYARTPEVQFNGAWGLVKTDSTWKTK